MRRALPSIAGLLAAVTIVGCSGTEPGQPITTSRPAAVEGDRLPGYGAPKVSPALEIGHFLQVPCDALTAAQRTDFLGSDVETTPDLDEATGPTCNWTTTIAGPSIHVGFPRISDQGLTTLYYDHDAKYAFFEETPRAAGYPAVAYGVTDNRDEGECAIRVGVSDRDTVDITLYLSDNKVGRLDPCEAAHEVATAVVGNIKARN